MYSGSGTETLTAQLRLRGGIEAITLTGARTLTARDANFLALDPGGSDRVITLPAVGDSAWLMFAVYNAADAAELITLKNVGATTIVVLQRGEGCIVGCDGATWFKCGPVTGEALSDFGSTGMKADVVAESTPAAGVNIDGVLVKDGNIVDSVGFYDAAAPTKIARVDAGNVTAGQTRVIAMADRNVDLDYAIQRARVSITPAEIRALRATQITLVAAPGATKFLEFVSAHLWLDFGAVAHDAPTNAGDDLAIRYTDGNGQVVGSQEATGFINAAADAHRIIKAGAAPVATVADVVPVANAALVLDNIGAAEYAGTGDSPLVVDILYLVRTLEPAT